MDHIYIWIIYGSYGRNERSKSKRMGLHHFLQLDFVWFLSSTHVDSNGVSSVAPTSSCWKWQEPTWGMFVMCLLLNYHWTTVSFLCIQYLNLFLVDSFKRRIWLYFNHEIIALQWYPSGEEDEHIAGWWFQTFFIFHFIYGIIILPIDFHILKDGYCTTNQSLFFRYLSGFFPDLSPNLEVKPPYMACRPCWITVPLSRVADGDSHGPPREKVDPEKHGIYSDYGLEFLWYAANGRERDIYIYIM